MPWGSNFFCAKETGGNSSRHPRLLKDLFVGVLGGQVPRMRNPPGAGSPHPQGAKQRKVKQKQSNAKQSKATAKQSKAKQSKAKQSKTKQSKATQSNNKPTQSKAKTKQRNAKQSKSNHRKAEAKQRNTKANQQGVTCNVALLCFASLCFAKPSKAKQRYM